MEISIKLSDQTATCNSCHASNYKSKFDRKQVDKLYEIQIGGINFHICNACAKELIKKLQKRDIQNIEGMYEVKEMTELAKECCMSTADFLESIELGYIFEEDGCADLILDGKIVSNATVHIDPLEVQLYSDDGSTFIPLVDIAEVFGDRLQIAWYNK